MDKAGVIQDAIPQEDFLETSGPNGAGMVAQHFFAFNTAITLQAFAGASGSSQEHFPIPIFRA